MSLHARKHPVLELEYQPVWSGATWRDYTVPAVDRSLPDYTVLNLTERQKARPSADVVAAWLTDVPRTAQQAHEDLGVSYSAVSHLLLKLARSGQAVQTWHKNPKARGRTIVRYARPR